MKTLLNSICGAVFALGLCVSVSPWLNGTSLPVETPGVHSPAPGTGTSAVDESTGVASPAVVPVKIPQSISIGLIDPEPERAPSQGPGVVIEVPPLDPVVAEPVPVSGFINDLPTHSILFFRDSGKASRSAANVGADLIDSQWHVLTFALDSSVARLFNVDEAPAFIALKDGKETHRSDGLEGGSAFVRTAYPEAFPSPYAAGQPWTVKGLRMWLAKYATNPHKGHAGVSGFTVDYHLTADDHPHGYDASLVAALTDREKHLLHEADHDELCGPDGPKADPLSKPEKRKPPQHGLPVAESIDRLGEGVDMPASQSSRDALPPPVIYSQSGCPNGQCPNPYQYQPNYRRGRRR